MIVIERFGKYHDTLGAGVLYLRLPFVACTLTFGCFSPFGFRKACTLSCRSWTSEYIYACMVFVSCICVPGAVQWRVGVLVW